MSSHHRLLIVHPDAAVCGLLASMLQTLGHQIEDAQSDRVAVRMMEQRAFDLVLAWADPSDADALEFLTYVRRKSPRTPVILLFPTQHSERQREAMQWGAASVLRYPLPATALRAAVAQAMGQVPAEAPGRGAVEAVRSASNGNGHGAGYANGQGHGAAQSAGQAEGEGGARPAVEAPALIGEDYQLRQAVELASSIAPSRAPVLIVGERGTGKTALAKVLHQRSGRTGQFVVCDAGALREDQVEAELFGRPGLNERPGKLAQARGGTLYIDQVSSLSPALQYRLLRLITDGEYEPAGHGPPMRSDARLVLGSREDLMTKVELNQFRQDLYYRISVVTLTLPPLRHRGEDILRLADYFRARFAREIGREITGFSAEALELLSRHTWPGNVLEIENVVERAVVLCRHGRIEASHLELGRREHQQPRHAASGGAAGRSSGRAARQSMPSILPLKEALEGPEKQLILQALEALNWNRQETARVLDINRTTLYKKMKKYGLLFDEPVWVN